MPKCGSKCKRGYYRVFNRILWVLCAGMQWKCLPMPPIGDGKAEIPYTTIYKVFPSGPMTGRLSTPSSKKTGVRLRLTLCSAVQVHA